MANKFAFYNDSKRVVSIHPATITHGCEVDMTGIQPGEIRVFTLPEGTYAWTKFWDYGEKGGLQLLVSPHSYDDTPVKHEPLDDLLRKNMIEQVTTRLFKQHNPHDKGERK